MKYFVGRIFMVEISSGCGFFQIHLQYFGWDIWIALFISYFLGLGWSAILQFHFFDSIFEVKFWLFIEDWNCNILRIFIFLIWNKTTVDRDCDLKRIFLQFLITLSTFLLSVQKCRDDFRNKLSEMIMFWKQNFVIDFLSIKNLFLWNYLHWFYVEIGKRNWVHTICKLN